MAPARRRPRAPKTPWQDANPLIPVGFNLRMDEVTHKKALYIVSRVPGLSQQKLYFSAVQEKIEQMLKELAK